jgi:hypothetical protein
MMEICVWITDQETGGNPEHDACRHVAGDVIEVLPDGSNWGNEVYKHPGWRIIRVPGLPENIADSLRERQKPHAGQPSGLLQVRGIHLDIEQLDILEGGSVLTNLHGRKEIHCAIRLDNLRSCIRVKKPINNPRIVGPRLGVVGT